MSNDAIQPIDDEISSSSKNSKEWVVNIEARLDNELSNPTKPLYASTDISSKVKPGILVYLRNIGLFASIECQGLFAEYWFRLPVDEMWQFVVFLTRWFGFNVRSYLEDIQENEDLVLEYYECGKITVEERSDFLKILLPIGCFLVFAILVFQNVRDGIEILSGTKEKRSTDPKDPRSKEFYILNKYVKVPIHIKCGMLDMEYQIPWFVVEAIYTKHSKLSKLIGTPIHILAFSCFNDLYPRVHKSKVHGGTGTLPPGGFKHLLHIFHWTRTPEGKHLVDMRSLQPINSMRTFYIPSATDLQGSATVYEKHDGIDVSYYGRRLSGVLQVAPWHLFDYSIQIFHDLLRFEQIYRNCGLSVTAYIACLGCLLQTKEDVRLLRENAIVPTVWNTEEDVLHCVHRFKTQIKDACVSNDLNILSEKVRAHHERSTSRYYAVFRRYYCPNPWITLSVFAGICLFVCSYFYSSGYSGCIWYA